MAAGDNPLVAHCWGASPAADRIFAQVVGRAPGTRPWERLLVVLTELQAHFDESYKTDGFFVIAGYIASAQAWANFSQEWEQLLPLTKRGKEGIRRFKMREMKGQIDDVCAFYRIIEKHVLMAISVRFRYRDLALAKASIWRSDGRRSLGVYNPYSFALRGLMDQFHSQQARERLKTLIPIDHPVDFYFDDNSSKRLIKNVWDEYITNRDPEARKFFGAEPRFDTEERLLPLQAADLLAYLVRECAERGDVTRIEESDPIFPCRSMSGPRRTPRHSGLQ
jgi:hypothetical protein